MAPDVPPDPRILPERNATAVDLPAQDKARDGKLTRHAPPVFATLLGTSPNTLPPCEPRPSCRGFAVPPPTQTDPVRSTSQLGPFSHGDDIVALRPELAGDLREEVLVEEQVQAESSSWAARHLASSAAFSSRLRAIQSSISSRLER